LLQQLGEPYLKLWSILRGCHGKRDAARVLTKLLGAIVTHGQHSVSQALQAVLDYTDGATSEPPPPTVVAVPEALRAYTIEAGTAASYDSLLEAAKG